MGKSTHFIGQPKCKHPKWMDRLQIIDSTPITLFSNLIFKGIGRHPKTGKKKGGLKDHTVIHANEGVPSDVKFTSAATNDSFMLEIAGCQASFNRSNRASIDRIKSLTIQNVPLETQNKVMAEVEEY
jgi:hypothetical protein